MVTASYGHYGQRQCSQNRAGSYNYADPTFRIRFSSVFPKKAWIILCKTEPDPIWMTWSGFGQTHQSVLETSRCAGIIWPGFWQDATGPLPFYHFLNLFRSSTNVPDKIVQSHPGSDLFLADCVRFWPNGSGPEASQTDPVRKQANVQKSSARFWPMLPSRSGPDANRIRHVYWVPLADS